jgi:hypothetical protein
MWCLDREPQPGEIDYSDSWAKAYTEFLHYPFYETTDIVMSFWFAREGAKEFLRGSHGPNIW